MHTATCAALSNAAKKSNAPIFGAKEMGSKLADFLVSLVKSVQGANLVLNGLAEKEAEGYELDGFCRKLRNEAIATLKKGAYHA